MSKKKKQKIEGIFRGNQRGYGFVEIENSEEDLFVPTNSVNGALDGDIVQVVIYKQKEGTKRAEAKVVKIVKREKETVIGIFQKSKNFGTLRRRRCTF